MRESVKIPFLTWYYIISFVFIYTSNVLVTVIHNHVARKLNFCVMTNDAIKKDLIRHVIPNSSLQSSRIPDIEIFS